MRVRSGLSDPGAPKQSFTGKPRSKPNFLADEPPFLLVHGDDGRVVTFQQSVTMERKLKRVGVELRFVTMSTAGHGPSISAGLEFVHCVGAMVDLFDRHLRKWLL